MTIIAEPSLPTATVSRPGRRLRIIVNSVASDSHTWNLVYLPLLMEGMGHRVRNLGACVPDELLVAECRRQRPDRVVVSSVNGHGHVDGTRLIRQLCACDELRGVPVVIGGKLGVASLGGDHYADDMMAAGFAAVFAGDADADVDDFSADVRSLSVQMAVGW
ncbi:MAG: methylaspartate mutase [Cryptosporangiaceae bacterium]|nr:methylaspartate mutase [Cryptosporangiaceae bacterium]